MTKNETAAWLKNHDNYVIITHKNPDGDTIGSAIGLCKGLRQLGKTASVFANPQFTPKFTQYLQGVTSDIITSGTTLVSVDMADGALCPPVIEGYVNQIQLAIDHHGSHRPFAENLYVEGDSAACTEVIYEILVEMGATITAEIATPLYVGLVTDTGRFLHSSVTPRSFAIAAKLKEAGCDTYAVNQVFFGGKPLRRYQLDAKLIGEMEFYKDGEIAVCPLKLSWMEEMGLNEDDMDAVSGFPRAIEGVKIGIVIKERDGGFQKISMRTQPGTDAATICGHLGGGGHKAAAGATVEGTYEDAKTAIFGAMQDEGVAV
ncbi:MAG: DHH family phosphoesterase [Eubacteriales bacterium]